MKFLEHTDNCFIYYCDWKFDSLVDDVVISKRFGFIWWLVENKKFKRYSAYKNLLDWDYVKFGSDWPVIPSVNWQLYDSILCWLAISDEPIRLLCEILK